MRPPTATSRPDTATSRRSTSDTAHALLPYIITIGLLTVGSWTVLLAAGAASGQFALVIGLGMTCWLLGARHALDADHIAAIDNTTRRLIEAEDTDDDDGTSAVRPARHHPASTGFWFALGHSTVVVLAILILSAGFSALREQLGDEESPLSRFTGIWGPLVSSIFLLAIAAMNLVMLRRTRREVRTHGQVRDAPRTRPPGGPLSQVFGPVMAKVSTPRSMYPVGLLFGLGFDTATTIGLIVISAGSAAVLPWWGALALPLVFTAGMTLVDTLDSTLMDRAYGWALQNHRRRLTYNTVVTGVSIFAAVGVAVITLASLIDEIAPDTPVLAAIGSIDLEYAGIALVALFIVLFGVALVTRSGHRRESGHARS